MYILNGLGKNCTHISTYAERYAKALASRRPLGQALSHRLNWMGGAL